MPYRLNVARLREAAARRGDTSNYKIMKRTGISTSALSRLANQLVEPTVTTLKRFMTFYDLTIEELLQEIDDSELSEAS
jgi:transcriptional regulator with XRE-family HTH domain